jgi:hypothetical protein
MVNNEASDQDCLLNIKQQDSKRHDKYTCCYYPTMNSMALNIASFCEHIFILYSRIMSQRAVKRSQ